MLSLVGAVLAQTEVKLKPMNIAYVVFPAFQALDVFGPLDALNLLSLTNPLNLSLIGPSLDPLSTRPLTSTPSNFNESVVPTHTFAAPPSAIDVLIVPGGLGTRPPLEQTQYIVDFVRETYPRVQYLISVCTGVTYLARAGVLDGRRATGNKAAWAFVKSTGPNVEWVAKARWVVDGNIYTSSGVSAGIDAILAWIKDVWGEDVALNVANLMEYERHIDPSWDPFADVWDAE